jgi:hypothetical protein
MDKRKTRKSNWVGLVLIIALTIVAGCFTGTSGPFEVMEIRKNESSGYYDAVVKTKLLQEHRNSLVAEFSVETWGRSIALGDLTFTDTGKKPDILEYGDIFIVPLVKPEWKIHVSHEQNYIGSQEFREMIPKEDMLDVTHSEAVKVAQSVSHVMDEGTLKPLPGFLPDGWELAAERPGYLRYEKLKEDVLVESVSINYRGLTVKEKELKTVREVVEYLAYRAYSPYYPGDDYGYVEVNGKPGVYRAERDIYTVERGLSSSVGRYSLSSGARYSLSYLDNEHFVYIRVWSSPYEWTLSRD